MTARKVHVSWHTCRENRAAPTTSPAELLLARGTIGATNSSERLGLADRAAVMDEFRLHRFRSDGLHTHTSEVQVACEEECAMYYASPDLFPRVRCFVLDGGIVFGCSHTALFVACSVRRLCCSTMRVRCVARWQCMLAWCLPTRNDFTDPQTKLVREQHTAYLLAGLDSLPVYFSGLDARCVWLCVAVACGCACLCVAIA